MKGFLTFCCVAGIVYFAAQEAKTEPSVVQTASATLVSNKPDPYDMNPWPSEKLSTVIELPNCPWVKVIEWRQSTQTQHGGPSESAKKILGDTCSKVVKNFPKYVKSHKYEVPTSFELDTFHQSLSLIPALENSEGFRYRNLNDVVFRFRDREKSYDELGQVNPIWGYTNFHNGTTYVRNDIINEDGTVNKKSVTVFAHEMYHALSWASRVNDIYHNDVKTEEEMALNFTQYLGYGR